MLWMDPRRPAPYVFEADRAKPEAERVTFQLAVLTPGEWASAIDLTAGDRDLWQGAFGLALLRAGLRGWSGAGAPPFAVDARGRPTDETLALLRPDDRGELAKAIFRVNNLTDAQTGKS